MYGFLIYIGIAFAILLGALTTLWLLEKRTMLPGLPLSVGFGIIALAIMFLVRIILGI